MFNWFGLFRCFLLVFCGWNFFGRLVRFWVFFRFLGRLFCGFFGWICWSLFFSCLFEFKISIIRALLPRCSTLFQRPEMEVTWLISWLYNTIYPSRNELIKLGIKHFQLMVDIWIFIIVFRWSTRFEAALKVLNLEEKLGAFVLIIGCLFGVLSLLHLFEELGLLLFQVLFQLLKEHLPLFSPW